jgi:hypothetical protein
LLHVEHHYKTANVSWFLEIPLQTDSPRWRTSPAVTVEIACLQLNHAYTRKYVTSWKHYTSLQAGLRNKILKEDEEEEEEEERERETWK